MSKRNKRMLEGVEIFATLSEAIPAIAVPIAVLIYFFWKLKTKKQTIIRLIIFSVISIPPLFFGIVGLAGNPIEGLNVVNGLAWGILGMLAAVRVLFDIRALCIGNWVTKEEKAPVNPSLINND